MDNLLGLILSFVADPGEEGICPATDLWGLAGVAFGTRTRGRLQE